MKRKPDVNLDLRNVGYFKPGLQPPLGEVLALRIVRVKDRFSPRRFPGWVVLVRFMHQKRNTQTNTVVYSAFINYDLNQIDLQTEKTSITPEQIRNGARYEQIREDLKFYITGYKVISYELSDDLSCFNLLDRYNLCIDLSRKPHGFYDKNLQPIDLRILNWVVNERKLENSMGSPIVEATAMIKAFHKLERGHLTRQTDENGLHSFQWIVNKFKNNKMKC